MVVCCAHGAADMPHEHTPTEQWLRGELTNFAYVMIINYAAGNAGSGRTGTLATDG